jgi:hypothetical protein
VPRRSTRSRQRFGYSRRADTHFVMPVAHSAASRQAPGHPHGSCPSASMIPTGSVRTRTGLSAIPVSDHALPSLFAIIAETTGEDEGSRNRAAL